MNELLVFAKFWEPGRVKTRLAADLGARAACQLHYSFLTATIDRLSSVGDRRCLQYSPVEAEPEFRRFVASRPWQIRPQHGADLGERLIRSVRESLATGATRVVILGADSPSLPIRHVEDAFDALQRHDVVIGPTDDGGYYMIGLRADVPELFGRIDWGTPRVMSQTLERIGDSQSSLTIEVLPSWYDIDHLEDLERLAADLREPLPRDAALVQLDQRIRHIVGR